MGKIIGFLFGAMLIPRLFWLGGIFGFVLGALFDNALKKNMKIPKREENHHTHNASSFFNEFTEAKQEQAQRERPKSRSTENTFQSIQAAYETLGVTASASDEAVKKAYRKLISQYHPDKLESKDLPPDLLAVAKEKTQAIRAAYEKIATARGMPH